MPQRSNDFQSLVAMVQRALAPKGAKVTESHLEPTDDVGEEREIDVLIESEIGPYRIRIAVEAKDERRKMDSVKFESIVGKYFTEGGVKVNQVAVVAAKGFYAPVKKRAVKLGVRLFTLSEVDELDWSQLAPRNGKPGPTLHIFDVEVTPELPQESHQLVTRGTIRSAHGNLGLPKQFISQALYSEKNRERLNQALEQLRNDPSKTKVLVEFDLGGSRHWLQYGGMRHDLQAIKASVKVAEGGKIPVDDASIRFNVAPHVCAIELVPPQPKERIPLLLEGGLSCKCCGKSGGTLRDAIRNSLNSLTKDPDSQLYRTMREGLANTSTGHVTVNVRMPLKTPHVVVHDETSVDVEAIDVKIHLADGYSPLEVKQFRLEEDDAEPKNVTKLEAIVAGKRLSILMPDGTRSDQIVLKFEHA